MQAESITPTIFERLGVRPVVNARGVYSVLGGSILSPRAWAAMEEANEFYVDMTELLAAAGRIFADAVGAEAAYPTTGASGALALGTAACLTGHDGEKMASLPETTGMRDVALIQRRHRYLYDRCVSIVGAKLTEVGDDSGTTLDQLAAAIDARTALVVFPAHLDGVAGSVSLRDVLNLAHDRGLPVLVDAAFDVFPTANMRRYAALGADLFCFSTKYFRGPNSVGFLCGRKEWIEAVALQGSVGYESRPYRSFFRSFKLDRQLIVAAIVALQEWLETDHDARWRTYRQQVDTVMGYVDDLPGLTLTPMYFTMDDTLEPSPINCLHIGLAAGGKSPRAVAAELRAASPAVVLHAYDDALVVVADALRAGDEAIVGERLRAALSQ